VRDPRLPWLGIADRDLAVLQHLGPAEPIELNRKNHRAPTRC
jgi:hypothetical protein